MKAMQMLEQTSSSLQSLSHKHNESPQQLLQSQHGGHGIGGKYYQISEYLPSSSSNNNSNNRNNKNNTRHARDCSRQNLYEYNLNINLDIDNSSNQDSYGNGSATKDIYVKYHQFVSEQNGLIASIISNTNTHKNINNNTNNVGSVEQMVNKLRSTSNIFIQKLLKQICSLYQQIRNIKQSQSAKISYLHTELTTNKTTLTQHDAHYQTLLEQQQQNHTEYTSELQQALSQTILSYQHKISALSEQISMSKQYYDGCYAEKLELRNQLAQVNRLVAMERQEYNEKYREYKGMEMLVADYQTSLGQFEKEVRARDARVSALEGLLKEVESKQAKTNQELNNCLKDKQNLHKDIQRLEMVLQQSRASSGRYLQQLTTLKQKHNEQLSHLQSAMQAYQSTQSTLTASNAQLVLTSQSLQSQIIALNNELALNENRIKQEKVQAKKIIDKIAGKYRIRQRMLKKMMRGQVNGLRKEKEQIKKYMEKQMFKFYQEVKMDFIIGVNQVKHKSSYRQ